MPADIDHVITRFHDAARAPDAWRDALRGLSDSLGAAGAACVVANKGSRGTDWVCFSGLSEALESRYVARYARLDPFAPLLNATPGWLALSRMLPKTVLGRSEWYNDFVLTCGVHDILGSRICDTPSHFVVVGLHQKIGGAFTDDTASIVKQVAPSVRSAASQHLQRLFGASEASAETTDAPRGDRFYFHVSNGRHYQDGTGQFFSRRDVAIAHAWVIAAELSRDKVWNGFKISVTDDAGRVIAEIPVDSKTPE